MRNKAKVNNVHLAEMGKTMSFTLDTIRKKCSSEEEYREGQALVPQTALDSIQSFWKGEVTLLASVWENRIMNRVEIVLGNGRYQSVSCTCKSDRSSLCRHGAAASLAYYSMIQRKTQDKPSTSPALKKILKEYQNQGITDMMQSQKEGKVRLIPMLTADAGRGRVSFKIGDSSGKSYIIKDLEEFYFRMKLHETVQYGKFLTVAHHRWSFAEDNLPLLDFVMRAAETELEYFRQYNPFRPETALKRRDITLSKEMLDQFLSMCIGDRLTVTDRNGNEQKTEVEEGNPKLSVRLMEGGGGFRLMMEDAVLVLEGRERLYVAQENKLYCTSPEFSRDMGVFLREAGRNGKTVLYEIGLRDMPGVCGQLLPCIARWARVDAEGIDLQQYTPKPVEASFSFDINENGAITCEETLTYGDFSFQPIRGISLPVNIYRDYMGEYRIQRTVERYFKYFDLDSGVLLLYNENDEEVFRLLDEGLEEFLQLGAVYISEAFKAVRMLPTPRISAGVSLKGNLLDLTFHSGGLSEEELAGLLKSYRLKKKFYRLKSGEFIKIEDTALAAFSEAADGLKLSAKELVREKLQVPAYRSMYLENVLSDRGIDFKRDREFKGLIRGMKSSRDSDFELPEGFSGTLRGYQEAGYQWLKTLSQYGFGGILADEMGLGKTVQVIALLLSAKEELDKPALIVCPASLVYNWENEFHRFAPELSVLVIGGNAEERERALAGKNRSQIWITSYDLLKRDIEQYREIDFSYQIIDEAQVIKNHSTQGAKAVKSVRSDHRFALTGTPIENRLSELWSIFDYLMKGYLYAYSYFREEFEVPIVKNEDGRAAARLRKLLAPFVLRRLKKEVLKELPEKLETVVYSRMEGEQRQLYAAYASKVRADLEGRTPEEYKEEKLQILAALTRLRQLCCDPALCYENYTAGSAKLNTCMELIEEGLEAGHRFLLFSQFTTMLDRIKGELEQRGTAYFLLTGATPKSERVQMAERFNAGEGGVFLISLKAGGTGLNLTGADMVIHYDPWWNLAAQDQATDRAHRIGQTQKVTVIKLVAKGTIEENIIRLQERKQRLAEQVIGEKESGISSFTQEELLEILKE